MGHLHRQILLEAGFLPTEASVSIWSAGISEEVQQCAIFLKAQMKSFSPIALAEGWIDQPTIEAVMAEIDAWSRRQDALYVDAYCEALGYTDS